MKEGGSFCMNENERILTVYEYLTPRWCREKYSRVLLQGKWLRDLGFKVGDKVSVKTVRENNEIKLVVSLAHFHVNSI